MVGEHVGHAIGPLYALLGNCGLGAVRADDHPRPRTAGQGCAGGILGVVFDNGGAVRVMRHLIEEAGAPFGAERAARARSHSSKCSRSTMPTKPPSIGMSTWTSFGETMRAALMRADNW